jgi:hypothetical protein
VGSVELNPGLLVPRDRLPLSHFLKQLGFIFADSRARRQLARGVHDHRFGISRFDAILARDLIELYRWAVQRVKGAVPSSGTTGLPQRVICLLPGTAFATHILRRAAPFAALGVPVVCSFPAAVQEAGGQTLARIANAIGLAKTLSAATANSEGSLASAGAETLCVVTGRRSTIEAVAEVAPGRTLGAAGSCAVICGLSAAAVAELSGVLSSGSPEESCTRVRAAFTVASWDPDSVITSGYGASTGVRVLDLVRELHPSVVFAPSDENPPAFVAGYRVLACDQEGIPATHVGFGADPVFGWPGDYLV